MKDNRCPKCDRTGKVKQAKTLQIFRYTPIHYMQKYYRCSWCKTEWYSSKMLRNNLREARKAYEAELNSIYVAEKCNTD